MLIWIGLSSPNCWPGFVGYFLPSETTFFFPVNYWRGELEWLICKSAPDIIYSVGCCCCCCVCSPPCYIWISQAIWNDHIRLGRQPYSPVYITDMRSRSPSGIERKRMNNYTTTTTRERDKRNIKKQALVLFPFSPHKKKKRCGQTKTAFAWRRERKIFIF